MSNFESSPIDHEMKRHLVAAIEHITMALRAAGTDITTDGLTKILSELDTPLRTNYTVRERKGGILKEMEEQLRQAEKVVKNWEAKQSFIWDSGPEETSEFLKAVLDIQRLTESSGSVSQVRSTKHKDLLLRAHCILEIAMSRLEEELRHILIQYKEYYEPKDMSFRSCAADVVYDESFASLEDEATEQTIRRDNGSTLSEQYLVNLVHPDMVPALKSIANAMFASYYHQEFCQAYALTRKHALAEYLVMLRMEKFPIEDVLKMSWDKLSCEIMKWTQAMKIIIRVYLASEKRLSDQILGEFGPVSSTTFVDITKDAMFLFLNFADAIIMSPHRPEKLFYILDMYEVLADLLIGIDTLFIDEVGSSIRIEFHNLLTRLGDYARATFTELRNSIVLDKSQKPLVGGGIHPLTRYTMNYIKALSAYRDTLNFLLQDHEPVYLESSLEADNLRDWNNSCSLASHVRLLVSVLESKLVEKSKLFKDCPLQHIFLMNNIHYMAEKIIGSELRNDLGDEWIRKHMGKYQQHANSYLRTTWSSALPLLQDAGSFGSNCCKSMLRARCKGFCIAFEEVYKCQTGWVVQDTQLRSDLQISTSQNVIQAYRTFLGKYGSSIGDKYIKYTADELDNNVLDLFEGSSKSLLNLWRR